MRTQYVSGLCALTLLLASQLPAQSETQNATVAKGSSIALGVDYLFNYLNMAGTKKATEFKPLTEKERTKLYFKTMINPLGYGKRFANILGQYSIQRTTTYGLASILHEDNRYFNSGKKSFWPRTGYALSSAVLARHDDGSRGISISQLGGVAAGAFVARLWLPSSQNSAQDGAVSFAITLGSNAAFSVVKEFLPDLGRAIAKKHKQPSPQSAED